MQPPTGPRWEHKFEVKPGSCIYIPTEATKSYGSYVKATIEQRWTAPGYFFHLNKGGHVKAIAKHISSSQYFFSVDIANFFGSINRSRVTRALKPLVGYTKARDFANNSTVKVNNQFHLPYGFVQSPLLASICLANSHLGTALEALHKQKGCQVTVYMDDITISSNDLTDLMEIYETLLQAASKSRFHLNESKNRSPSTTCESFNINFGREFMRLTEQRMNEFADAYQNSSNEHQRKGILSYIGTVCVQQKWEIEPTA